jgi:hypothetical protein
MCGLTKQFVAESCHTSKDSPKIIPFQLHHRPYGQQAQEMVNTEFNTNTFNQWKVS